MVTIKRNAAVIGLCLLLAGCSKEMEVKYLNMCRLTPYKEYSFQLTEPFMVSLDSRMLTIPRGFITDLASIPRFLWSFYSPTEVATVLPAVIHDYLYACVSEYNRLEADNIFYYALRENGVSKIKALKYYYAVRFFGWAHYRPILCE